LNYSEILQVTRMSDATGPPTAPPAFDISNMKAGRVKVARKKSVPVKDPDLLPVETKVGCNSDDQPTELSTIQILFGNANMDGSISDSAANLELLKKLWVEIGETTEFDIENIKTTMNLTENSVAFTTLAVCIFNSKYFALSGLGTSISKAERFLCDQKIDFKSMEKKLEL